MSYPPNYDPTTSFADDESTQAAGRSTVRTVQLDTELADIAASINVSIENLKAILRSDAKLRDFIVEPYALSEQLRAMLATAGVTVRGEWQANTVYAVKDLVQRNAVAYICQTAHNSGPSFNLGFWIAISGDGSAAISAELAQNSQMAAAASEVSAIAAQAQAIISAAAALASQFASASSALAAQNSADSIAALTPVNLSAFMLGFLGNNNAGGARSSIGVIAAADFSNNTDPSKGGGIPTFVPSLNYVAGTLAASVKDGFVNLMWFVTSEAERAAIKNYTTTTDHTAIINAAMAMGAVYAPPGLWNINPAAGAILQNGYMIQGAGWARTIFKATANGATPAQLAAYTGGAIFRRAFSTYQTVTGGVWPINAYSSTNGLGQLFKINNNSATNHSGKTVTITGTDVSGVAQSEVLVLPIASGRVSSVKQYKTVTSIAPSASIGADTMDVCLENPYVAGVRLSDFAIIMNHPTFNLSNYRQIGLDLRNISYSEFDNLYIGNEAPLNTGFPISLPGQVHRNQGYGIAIGTRSSGLLDYCGGEGNIIRSPKVFGAYKCIVIDDAVLSPNSSTPAVVIDKPNLQHGHMLLTQESQYSAGLVLKDILVQGNDRQPGNAEATTAVSIAGYNIYAYIMYAEMGPFCDKLFEFTSTARLCKGEIQYWFASAPSTSTILDNGATNSRNKLTYNKDLGSLGGTGALVDLYNKAPLLCTWKGSGTPAADMANGISITRSAVGVFDITLAVPQPNVNLD